ncbi:hypothetical protein FHQ08_10740 [Lactobacillus sp. CC-MHH1034]|uniref:hypothetical protein n=1 Tax=Agrilactobacillus fermenti TaxID=2586909 RepID=UPI001E5DF9A4|nr:hypothetical protein [Agrilactobacillus fermenti]MCD2257195.1 hypothetical protein [Agrilactobacillus fermenti]
MIQKNHTSEPIFSEDSAQVVYSKNSTFKTDTHVPTNLVLNYQPGNADTSNTNNITLTTPNQLKPGKYVSTMTHNMTISTK